MGQFDSTTEAALAQLKIDQSALSPVSFAVEKPVGIGSKILELAGYQGASVTADLVFGLKGLAAANSPWCN